MWNDFNLTTSQLNPNTTDIIPDGTLAKVRMIIKPGAHNDSAQGWTGGYATRNDETGSVYLVCEFIILEGQYARRKIWSLIGLHSNKGPQWGDIGKSFIKSILNSAYDFTDKDTSPEAQQARKIKDFGDLNGIEFVAKITTKKTPDGELRNEIRFAITPEHKDYKSIRGAISSTMRQPEFVGQAATQPSLAQSQSNNQSSPARPTNRPAWAQ